MEKNNKFRNQYKYPEESIHKLPDPVFYIGSSGF